MKVGRRFRFNERGVNCSPIDYKINSRDVLVFEINPNPNPVRSRIIPALDHNLFYVYTPRIVKELATLGVKTFKTLKTNARCPVCGKYTKKPLPDGLITQEMV